MKRCPRCRQGLPADAFARDRTRPDGRSGWCKGCRAEYAQRWRDSAAGVHAQRAHNLARRRKRALIQGEPSYRDHRRHA